MPRPSIRSGSAGLQVRARRAARGRHALARAPGGDAARGRAHRAAAGRLLGRRPRPQRGAEVVQATGRPRARPRGARTAAHGLRDRRSHGLDETLLADASSPGAWARAPCRISSRGWSCSSSCTARSRFCAASRITADAILDRMSDALSLLAAPLIDEAGRLGASEMDAVLERPADPDHGDYATTLALRLAKPLRRPPRQIAEEIAAAPRASECRERRGGRSGLRQRARVARLVSARRCAPLARPGSAAARRCAAKRPRGARLGQPDRLADRRPRPATLPTAMRWRACSSSRGTRSTREYYFNDAGAQIERFGVSVRAAHAASRCPRTATGRDRRGGRASSGSRRRVRREFTARGGAAHVRRASGPRSSGSGSHGHCSRRGGAARLRRWSSARSRAPAPPGTSSRPRARRGSPRRVRRRQGPRADQAPTAARRTSRPTSPTSSTSSRAATSG